MKSVNYLIYGFNSFNDFKVLIAAILLLYGVVQLFAGIRYQKQFKVINGFFVGMFLILHFYDPGEYQLPAMIFSIFIGGALSFINYKYKAIQCLVFGALIGWYLTDSFYLLFLKKPDDLIIYFLLASFSGLSVSVLSEIMDNISYISLSSFFIMFGLKINYLWKISDIYYNLIFIGSVIFGFLYIIIVKKFMKYFKKKQLEGKTEVEEIFR